MRSSTCCRERRNEFVVADGVTERSVLERGRVCSLCWYPLLVLAGLLFEDKKQVVSVSGDDGFVIVSVVGSVCG